MGICASCLGLNRNSRNEDFENSRLLGDPYPQQYGGVSPGDGLLGPEPDPEDLKRERDALERLCAQTSDKLIDVSQVSYMSLGSKMQDEYAKLFNQMFPKAQSANSSSSQLYDEEQAWIREALNDDEHATTQKWNTVEPVDDGGLVMQFEEVLSVDKRTSKSTKQ